MTKNKQATKNSRPNLAQSKKTFQQNGKWVEKAYAKIIICACGNKYIKTRELQTTCIRCWAKNSELLAHSH